MRERAKQTAFKIAAQKPDLEVMKILLAYGADIGSKEEQDALFFKNRQYGLFWTYVRANNLPMILFLLTSGLNVRGYIE